MEKSLRTVLVATRLARLVGLGSDELADVFWVSALRLVGCLGFAHEEAAFAAGDDNSMRGTLVYADFDQPLDVLGRVIRAAFAQKQPDSAFERGCRCLIRPIRACGPVHPRGILKTLAEEVTIRYRNNQQRREGRQRPARP